MRLLVITNRQGSVIGTARVTESKDANTPSGGRPVPGDGQQVHEIALPAELHHIRSAHELHREVTKLMKSSKP